MLFRNQNPKKIASVLIFSFLFLLMNVLQQSCKKVDDQLKQSTTLTAIDPTIKFFNLSATVTPSVKKIAEKIKLQNEQTHFVAEFVKTQGNPIWDKAVITTMQARNSGRTSSTTTTSNNEEFVLIPLALQDSNQVHGAIWCKVNGDSVAFKLLDGSKYNWYNAHPDSTGLTGEQLTLLLLKLDRVAFGDSIFKIKDSLAFGINVSRQARYIKITDEVNSNIISNNAPSRSSVGHWEYYWYNFSYVTYEPNKCGCDATPCPDGSMHEVYKTQNFSGNIWIEDDNWNTPNEGGTGGGGGGNGGSGNGDLPVDPVGDDPLDPIPTVYQLTANDVRVINQLNAEDAETDYMYSNLDCQGT